MNQHTELEHAPSNLYQQAISRDSFHSWPGGLPGVCDIGVCCNFLGMMPLLGRLDVFEEMGCFFFFFRFCFFIFMVNGWLGRDTM